MFKKIVLLCCLCLSILCTKNINSYGNTLYNLQHSKEKSNISILVDLTEQKLYLIDTDKNIILKQYWIASGKSDTPSPIGCWRVISKGEWSGGFGTRWLGLNVPWGHYGIHGTNKPHSIGKEESHGCIRMLNDDIEELYQMVNYGTRVVIYAGPNGPFHRGCRSLKPGDRGADVYYIQRKLKELNYYTGALDGVYGEEMKKSVIKFREDKRLKLTHDVDKEFCLALEIQFFE
ncbi:hypothetical protein CPJCM30710_01860 [Clostridium polyendosporum]|uniref:L,D-TPase catalytic domain-containing protein n=1 Tax=Clostridium polyendosporum TaxID=69208 RepID=A0A919RXZ7_9CLOT|nr:L,D-transpeptidase family protein [Clostridium polyendosporum]GIM27520.1 hypothetical protein CPJCM30710_01860 [Clostridium polyendosporum]